MTIQEAMAKYVGPVDNLSHVDYHNVFDDRYRVNFWCNRSKQGHVVTTKFIKHTFFIRFDAAKNVFIDKSITPTYDLSAL